MEKDQNFVSVIVPTIGRSSIEATKTALKKQTRLPDEIIIIEDVNQSGPSWARNEGMKKAKGNLIAFTDDDCIPDNDWIERFIKAIEVYNASMVSSDFKETDPFLDEIRQRRNFPDSVRINPEGFVGNTGNVMYRQECLDECVRLDGIIFNPIYGAFASEDIDLVFRLKKRGHTLVYINNKVKHLKEMSLLHYLKHQLYRGIGIGILYQLHKKTYGIGLPDQSLLWKRRENSVLKFILLLWKKILGPFDYQSFSRKLYFTTFWAGEKAQALGFTMCLIFKRIE